MLLYNTGNVAAEAAAPKKDITGGYMELRLCAFADEAARSLDGQIDALTRNGIGLIEVRGIDGKNVSDFTPDEAKKYADALRAAGIRVYSLGSPLGKTRLSDDFKAERERLDRLIRTAHIFGCRNIRMFSFYAGPDGFDRDTVLNRLGYFVCRAADGGIVLCHENEKDIYGDIPSRVADILDSIGGLKSVYDPANYLQCGVSADESMPLVDRAEYLHIKDVIAATGEVVPAGCGDGRIGDVIDRFGRDGVLTVEPHLRVFDGYNEIDGTELKNKYSFATAAEAFDCAVGSLKKILSDRGFTEKEGIWTR